MSKPIRIKNFESVRQQTSPLWPKPVRRTAHQSSNLVRLQASHGIAPFLITPQELSLTLPLPPSINHQYATVNGRRTLSSKGRQYKATVSQDILSTLTTSPHRTALLNNLKTHSLILSVWFYFTSALRRDLDGGLKIAQDAICNALGINDNRIGEIHLYRGIDAKTPRIECQLTVQGSAPLCRPKKKNARARKKLTTHTSP